MIGYGAGDGTVCDLLSVFDTGSGTVPVTGPDVVTSSDPDVGVSFWASIHFVQSYFSSSSSFSPVQQGYHGLGMMLEG